MATYDPAPAPKPIDWNRWLYLGASLLLGFLSGWNIRPQPLPVVPPEFAEAVQDTRATAKRIEAKQDESLSALKK